MNENQRQGYEEGVRIGATIAVLLFLVVAVFLAYTDDRKKSADTETYTDYRVRKAMEATKNVPVSAYPEYHQRP